MIEITYEGKKYRFSTWSLVVFPAGTILVSLGLYFGTETWFAESIHWFVAIQTSWLLHLLGINVDIQPVSPPIIFDGRVVWWRFTGAIPSSIYFTHDCSGFQAIAIFLALILFIPHSQDKEANRGIWRRKGVSMVISSLLFHVVNVARMVIQISLYHAGLPWESIHYSISAASSIIAAIIIILMNRWIPEFILSIIVIGRRIGNLFKSLKKIPPKEIPSNANEIPLASTNTGLPPPEKNPNPPRPPVDFT